MNSSPKNLSDQKKSGNLKRRHNVRQFIEEVKKLQGDPHYVAMGMAMGVFVSVTPTINFHTVIAVLLAIILRGSKPAAVIGVWFFNPVTIPIFYVGSYKFGMFLFGKTIPVDVDFESISKLLEPGLDLTVAMIVGGAILGVLPAIAAYFIRYKMISKIRLRRKKDKMRAADAKSASEAENFKEYTFMYAENFNAIS